MNHVICTVPLAPVRIRADHRTEMTSQYLFGETATIVDRTDNGWLKLIADWDEYPGWCRANQFTFLPQQLSTTNPSFAGEWANDVTINGQVIKIPFGCELSFIQEMPWITVAYSGKAIQSNQTGFSDEHIQSLAATFLGTGYLWGGRSVFGIDCSGFVQMVYRMMNISLQRDANMQAKDGVTIGFLEETKCGDLAFFDDEEGEIVHVGMLLDPLRIIHSSGDVRIDHIDHEGITHSQNHKRTHKLRIIKRML